MQTMLPTLEQKSEMESKLENSESVSKKKNRNFPELQLNEQTNIFAQDQNNQPVLVIQSPKTPTLSRKLKAVSLDSDAGQKKNLEVSRDVSSVPNTPKKQANKPEPPEVHKTTPFLGSNLKKFASSQSISGSQTLKALPEVMTVHEFSGTRSEPVRIKAKGLLERRGSNASLTIDLGSNSNLTEPKRPIVRLNTAKSVSHLNLTSFGVEKCLCESAPKLTDNSYKKINHSETCGNCTIYESVPSASNSNKHHEQMCKCTLKFLPKYYIERHCVCNIKYRRKSLSNENLYVPPCNFCHFGSKECYLGNKSCNRGTRKALYPRQTYIETSQLLSEDFKLHLQNVQYLQTAGSVLSIAELKSCCQVEKLSRLHQEFWEVPLNLQEKCLVSGSQSRNRYKSVLPNEHSRVHLPGQQSYIHANYIKGPDYTETAYIATQGPMTHTCEDFWNMIWCNKVQRIVMLTALIERGRSKCELYFPLGGEVEDKFILFSDGVGETTNNLSEVYFEDEINLEPSSIQEYGPFQIKYISKENLGECVIRKLEIINNLEEENASKSRTVLHYWYPNWADHKQANPEQVLQIALHVLGINNCKHNSTSDSSCSAEAMLLHSSSSSEVETADDKVSSITKFSFDFNYKKPSSFDSTLKDNNCPFAAKFPFEPDVSKPPDGNPIVVHCSAGIGRTGCFLAILNGIHQLRTNYNVDILAIVCSLRLNRGGMVQTAEQYELIHRVLSLYADMI